MSWRRYDDGFNSHPKITALIMEGADGIAAVALHPLANTWTSRTARPGFVPTHQPGALLADRELGARAAAMLEKHGLFDAVEGGWMFHDYADYDPPASRQTSGTPTDLSAKRAEAGRKGGQTTAARKQVLQQTQQDDTASAGNACSPEPVPEPSQQTSSAVDAHNAKGHEPLTDEACPAIVDSMRDERRRGTRITADWRPSDDMRAWTLEHLTSEQAAAELDRFRDFWTAKAGRDAAKLDWDATWRNWIRTSIERRGTPARRPVPAPSGPAGVIDRSEFVGVPA